MDVGLDWKIEPAVGPSEKAVFQAEDSEDISAKYRPVGTLELL